MKYIFKATTQYQLVVEADDEEVACEIAHDTPFYEWEVTERPEAEWVGPLNE